MEEKFKYGCELDSTMDWKEWKDKRIFVKTKTSGVYSGVVKDVDDSDKSVIFITLIDKFGDKITIVHSEILKIIEEKEWKG